MDCIGNLNKRLYFGEAKGLPGRDILFRFDLLVLDPAPSNRFGEN